MYNYGTINIDSINIQCIPIGFPADATVFQQQRPYQRYQPYQRPQQR